MYNNGANFWTANSNMILTESITSGSAMAGPPPPPPGTVIGLPFQAYGGVPFDPYQQVTHEEKKILTFISNFNICFKRITFRLI